MGKIAIFTRSLGGGGIQRAMVALAAEFAARGHQVDCVLVRARGTYLDDLPDSVRVVDLGIKSVLFGLPTFLRHPRKTLSLTPVLLRQKPSSNYGSVGALMRYLEREKPDAVLSSRPPCNIAALWAREACGSRPRVVVCEQNSLGKAKDAQIDALRRFYPLAEAIVCTSDGVGLELIERTGISAKTVHTIHNPLANGAKPDLPKPNHPWFQEDTPIFLGVGRLHPQKDFPTLLRAFAKVQAEQPSRLVILGRGALEDELKALAAELGVADAVAFPGFVSDVFAWMANASAFVLSSAWEGFGNVIIEAMGCGCPVVSTDCPSGPAEILQDGALGPLVPVGDAQALAAAMTHVLAAPTPTADLLARAAEFSAPRVAEQYLKVLLPDA